MSAQIAAGFGISVGTARVCTGSVIEPPADATGGARVPGGPDEPRCRYRARSAGAWPPRTAPRLTTVRQPLDEMGRAMIRLLLEDLEEPSVAYRHVILRTELQVRESA